MNRIVLGMACTNYLLVALTVYLGLLTQGRGETEGPDLFHYHLIVAISTALFTMFVHCIVFTYFLGTSRWVRETSAAYSLDRSYADRSQKCRLRALSVAMIGVLAVVAAVASGAWTDTALQGREKDLSLWVHRIIPGATYVFMLFAYRIEIHAIEEHIALTDEVMGQVDKKRKERGLPSVAEQLAAAR